MLKLSSPELEEMSEYGVPRGDRRALFGTALRSARTDFWPRAVLLGLDAKVEGTVVSAIAVPSSCMIMVLLGMVIEKMKNNF